MGMLDISMEELEAKAAALEGEAPAETAKPADGAEAPAEGDKPKFQPKALSKHDGADAPAESEDGGDDYFGIEVEGVDYKVPQVDMDAVNAVREKATKGEALSEYEQAVVAQGDFNEELAKYGLDWNAITVEYHKEGGRLTEATLGQLCEVFPKPLVLQYMAGVDASHAAFLAARDGKSKSAEEAAARAQREAEEMGKLSFEIAYEAAGGKAAFEELSSWAKSELPEDELEAMNEAIVNLDLSKASDKYTLKALIVNLANKRKAAEGNPGVGILPTGRATAASEDGPITRAQHDSAVRDPRYARDKSWAAKMDARRLAGIRKGL